MVSKVYVNYSSKTTLKNYRGSSNHFKKFSKVNFNQLHQY